MELHSLAVLFWLVVAFFCWIKGDDDKMFEHGIVWVIGFVLMFSTSSWLSDDTTMGLVIAPYSALLGTLHVMVRNVSLMRVFAVMFTNMLAVDYFASLYYLQLKLKIVGWMLTNDLVLGGIGGGGYTDGLMIHMCVGLLMCLYFRARILLSQPTWYRYF